VAQDCTIKPWDQTLTIWLHPQIRPLFPRLIDTGATPKTGHKRAVMATDRLVNTKTSTWLRMAKLATPDMEYLYTIELLWKTKGRYARVAA